MKDINSSNNEQSSSTPAFPGNISTQSGPKITHDYSSTGDIGSSDDFQFTWFKSLITEQANLEKRIGAIEKQQAVAGDFYKQALSTSKTARIIMIILMIIPIIQIIICAGIIYYLGIQEHLSGLLKWGLGWIGIASLGEVVLFPTQFYLLQKKVDDLEKKIDK